MVRRVLAAASGIYPRHGPFDLRGDRLGGLDRPAHPMLHVSAMPRLRHEVTRPNAHACLDDRAIDIPGNHNHRRPPGFRVAFDLTQYLQAIEPRKRDIQQDHVRLVLQDNPFHFGAVRCLNRPETGPLHAVNQWEAGVLLILHNQNQRGVGRYLR